jgi:HK97 family phage portal protein
MALTSSLERRFHPSQNPDGWFLRHFGNEPSIAGVTVNEDTALSATAVWAGVRIIAETVAMLPLELYERQDDRTKKPARALTLWKVIHDEPNPEQTSFEFREMQQGFLLLWGNCYAQKIYNGRGEVSELWPLVPWRVTPERTANNTLVYRVRLPGNQGGEVTLPADDVLHIKGFSSGGVLGDNVVEKFRNSIGLSLAAEEFGGRFFGNGLTASGGLEFPGKLGVEGRKNVRDSFTEAHGGVGKSHRLMILEEGMKWFQMTVDPEKAQALQTRKFQVTEVSRILRLPPHLLYDLERSTFTNIEHQGLEFVTYSMQPWLTRWEQRLNRSLLLPSQRQKYFTQFEVKGLLRGDVAARSAFYQQMFNVGAYSPNDILNHEGEQPVEGGDQRFVQLNLTPLDQIAEMVAAQIKDKPPLQPKAPDKPAEPAKPEPAARSVLEPVVRAEVERVVRRQVKAVRAAVKKSPQEFRVWADSFFEKETGIVTESLTPALASLSALAGVTFDARSFASQETLLAITDVKEALKVPDELDSRIDVMLSSWETERVESMTKEILK